MRAASPPDYTLPELSRTGEDISGPASKSLRVGSIPSGISTAVAGVWRWGRIARRDHAKTSFLLVGLEISWYRVGFSNRLIIIKDMSKMIEALFPIIRGDEMGTFVGCWLF